MPNRSNGEIGRVAGTYIGATSAVAVHFSRRVGLAKEFGGSIGEECGSERARNEVARARGAACNTLGFERSGDFEVVGVGRARVADHGLQISIACELVACVDRKRNSR